MNPKLTDYHGLEALTAMVDGRIPAPPFAELLGLRITKVEPGRVEFTATPSAEHYNPTGTVHGGFAASLLDSALACAILSTLERGVSWTTLELKINYVRAMTEDTGQVICVGESIHTGRTIALAEGRIFDPEKRLIAHATTTCLLLPQA